MRIPGFVILEPLGESSMTEVWKAYQKSLKREVTLKILKDEFTSQEVEVERFCAEAKQTANLSHERIVQIYNVSHHDGRPYLVMEHVGGPTLEDAPPAASGALRPDQAAIFDEQLDHLGQALQQLPYEQREVLLLRCRAQMRFAAIAKAQGVSINTVQGRYRYAIQKLRSLLDVEAQS